jgi:hypothetical protein
MVAIWILVKAFWNKVYQNTELREMKVLEFYPHLLELALARTIAKQIRDASPLYKVIQRPFIIPNII